MSRRALSVVSVLAVAAGGLVALSSPASAAPVRHGTQGAQANLAARVHGRQSNAQRARTIRNLRADRATTSRRIDARTSSTNKAGTVTVAATGSPTTVAARTRALGGTVLASHGQVSSVVIDGSAVRRLESASGVGTVTRAIRAVPQKADPSEGVARSGADVWQNDTTSDVETTGAGTTVAIVDAGFTGYQAAITADDLPASTTVDNVECNDGTQDTVDTGDHGTAVAEIVHQTAPGAAIRLYCIQTTVGLAAAAADIKARGIKLVNMSLGFPGDARGDGTGTAAGADLSAAGIVRTSRQQGALWVVSAGNDAADHWSGRLADADQNGYVEIDGVYDEDAGTFEDDEFYIAGGSNSVPAVADVTAQWDSWPTNKLDVVLQITGFQCTHEYDSEGCGAYPITLDANGLPVATPDGKAQPLQIQGDGTAPVSSIALANLSPYEQIWDVDLLVPKNGYPSTRYDLTYGGEVDGPSYNACVSLDSDHSCVISPRSYQNSLASPANSPYALAVGAASAGADGTTVGALRQYSSRGPTIDGRTKPEITAWDGVTSPVYGPASTDPQSTTGFYGTSAAAPHVAGAAALVLGANPDLDVADVQNLLEQRASHTNATGVVAGAYNPPNANLGYGLLTLGAVPSAPGDLVAAGSRYQSVPATRIANTVSGSNVPKRKLAAGGTITVPVTGLPADATAVAVNLTGIGASGSTYVSAYPGATFPGTSNLNLSTFDPTAGVFAVVRLAGSGASRSITVRNNAGTVDLTVDMVGYFGTGSETGHFTGLSTPSRVYNSNNSGALVNGASVPVTTGAPTGTAAAIVNLGVAVPPRNGYLTATKSCGQSSTVSLLNYGRYSRANLSIVPLDSTGHFCLKNVGGTVNATVDVVGYLGEGGTSEFHALASATRVIDTRNGNGGAGNGAAGRTLGTKSSTPFVGSAVGVVPSTATALLTNVVEASNTGGGYVTLLPGTSTVAPATSSVLFSKGRSVANAAVVGLASNRFSIYNAVTAVHVATDVAGYFAPTNQPG